LPPADPDPRLRALHDGRPVVGFAARLHPQKAPLLLLDALEELQRRAIPFAAALVGDGPLADAVQERIARTELRDHVLVLPFCPDAAAILAGFDVYALPSLWESLPIALLEAMSAGLPVVAADTGGVREAVLNGDTGLLHPPGDATALADALQRLLTDPELRARMGAAGRARQAAEFSLDSMIEGVERAYRRALTVTSPTT
jgi:glycosyltransferase involved in cell wall biosynthesis